MEKTVDKDQTIDETKRKLKDSREQLEAELEVQLQDIKKDATDIGKQILLVGGGIYLSYRVLKALTTSKKDKQRKKKRKAQKKNDSGTGFGQMILHQLMTIASVAITNQIRQSLQNKSSANDRNQNS